jgi:hypothetical protein
LDYFKIILVRIYILPPSHREKREGRNTFTNPPVANSGRSEHRKVVGENTPHKLGVGLHGQQTTGRDLKNTATGLDTGMANRSASRNAGAAIVDLKDYKSEKGEVATGNGQRGYMS